jgi:hypothetical protein
VLTFVVVRLIQGRQPVRAVSRVAVAYHADQLLSAIEMPSPLSVVQPAPRLTSGLFQLGQGGAVTQDSFFTQSLSSMQTSLGDVSAQSQLGNIWAPGFT